MKRYRFQLKETAMKGKGHISHERKKYFQKGSKEKGGEGRKRGAASNENEIEDMLTYNLDSKFAKGKGSRESSTKPFVFPQKWGVVVFFIHL